MKYKQKHRNSTKKQVFQELHTEIQARNEVKITRGGGVGGGGERDIIRKCRSQADLLFLHTTLRIGLFYNPTKYH